jgi:hypothetical protein
MLFLQQRINKMTKVKIEGSKQRGRPKPDGLTQQNIPYSNYKICIRLTNFLSIKSAQLKIKLKAIT